MAICSRSLAAIAWAGILWTGAVAAIAAEARVEMIVATEGPSSTQIQPWFKLLTDLRVDNLQIRGSGTMEKVAIEQRGSATSPTYVVSAVLTQGNRLIVPGGQFSSSDRQGLQTWIERLRREGPQRAAGAPREPFGLLPALRTQVNADLGRAVDFKTQGESLKGAVERMAVKLAYPLLADNPSRAALAAGDPVADELQGVATGTALAALLRTAGYAMVPRAGTSGKPEYLLVPAKATAESWPIGWPAPKKDSQLVPALVEMVNVEIDEAPVSDIIDAITKRVELPVIFDRVAMARQRLDPAKVSASMPAGKSMYSIVLHRSLFKAGLTYELRVDDAGKPLMWITSVVK